MHVVHYWKALGKPIPVVSDTEIQKLLRDFDDILFAWQRLKLPNPQFPYTYLMRQIVAQMSNYSPAMHQLTQFLRVLKCKKRRKRYDILFQKCLNIVNKNFDFDVINDDKEESVFSGSDSEPDSVLSGPTNSVTSQNAVPRNFPI